MSEMWSDRLERFIILAVALFPIAMFSIVMNRKPFLRGLLSSFGTAISFAGMAIFFTEYQQAIDLYRSLVGDYLRQEWAFPPAVALALVFFRFRGSRPFRYGLFEVFVGAIAIWIAIHTSGRSLVETAIPFFGGIYIIVRGLDNIDKGLPERYRSRWDKVFPKAARSSTP
jgi:hypothetical protein